MQRGFGRSGSLAAAIGMAIVAGLGGAMGGMRRAPLDPVKAYPTPKRKPTIRERIKGTTPADIAAMEKAQAKRARKGAILARNESRMQAARLMQMENHGYTWPQLVNQFMRYHPKFASGRPFELLDKKIYELGKDKRFRPQGLVGSLYQAAADVHAQLAQESQKQAA